MPAGIIKRQDVRGAHFEAAETVLDQPVRVSRDRVHLKAAPREDVAVEKARTRVLRGEATRRLATPFEVEIPEWTPDVPLPDSQRRAQPAPDEPEIEETPPEPEPAPDLDALRAEWDAEWQERLDAAVAAARAEGVEEGRAQAQSELFAEHEERLETVNETVGQLHQMWTDHIETSTPLLTELAVEVAEMLLDAPLPSTIKSASARAIAEAVEELAGETSIVVALHPVDYQRLQETGIVDQLESVHAELRWDPDPDLDEGDWVAEAPSAVIRRVRDNLVATLRNRLGLLSLGQKYSD